MPTRVLLIGGHGKISRLLTPLLLSKQWHLTSLIRSAEQSPTITSLGTNHPGQLALLVHSIEEIKTQSQAQSIIDSTTPNYIVWSAGAGGKGGAERTFAIDRDACIAFARAAAATKSVSKFLVVSYIGSRKAPAPWWSAEDAKASEEINSGVLKNYYIAKLAADRALTALGRKKGDGFAAISLRPGALTDEEAGGRVKMGKIASRGSVRRGDVAKVIAEVLEKVGKSYWLDLLEGEDGVEEAVGRCLSERIDCVQGEDVDDMIKEWAS